MTNGRGRSEPEQDELRGATKALAFVLLPPVLGWEIGRALVIHTLPRLLRGGWARAQSAGVVIGRFVRAAGSQMFLPIARGAVAVLRAFSAALKDLVRTMRHPAVRLLVLLREIAGPVAIVARRSSSR